jgi:hypothetical protein
MSGNAGRVLTTLALVVGCAPGWAEEANAKIAEQKKAARENWSLLEAGEPAHLETAHLLIYASGALEGRLKDISTILERHYAVAEKALKPDPQKELWPGKLTVYLFTEREQFTTYVRRVEKRRPDLDETSNHAVEGDFPRVFAGPPRSKSAGGLEASAGQEVAAALLQRKAGSRVILPDWLLVGFGRATTWRAFPAAESTRQARQQAAAAVVSKKRTAQQVWGPDLTPDEAAVLRPALADLLAYGPGAPHFLAFLTGFRPEEGQERKSTEQALEAAGIKLANLEVIWPGFVRAPR